MAYFRLKGAERGTFQAQARTLPGLSGLAARALFSPPRGRGSMRDGAILG